MLKPRLFSAPFNAYISTQFLGAFNDNVFKNGLTLTIIYTLQSSNEQQALLLINLAAALFILPFIIFSPIAGQLTQHSEKSHYIRRVKLAEIIIMLLASYCFITEHIIGLLIVLFLMGSQSAFFGPVKYSILPLLLDRKDLYSANSIVEASTFIAILTGLFLSTYLLILSQSPVYLCITIMVLSCLGYVSSLFIPTIKEAQNHAPFKLNFNVIHVIKKQAINIKQQPQLLTIMLGISWFWFIGVCYLTQLPAYTKNYIHAQPSVYNALLITFSLGIGLGSLSSRLGSTKLSLKALSLIGLIGLISFGIVLSLIPEWDQTSALNFPEFLNTPFAYLLLIIISFIGISGGWFIVPLYTLLQLTSDNHNRSQMVANNNILNALFMVASSVFAIVIISLGFSISTLFLCTSLASVVVLWHLKNSLANTTIKNRLDR